MIAFETMPMRWPLSVPALRESQVHVWRAELSVLEQRHAYLEQLLWSGEQQRALRYRLPVHQRRFRLVRGALRELLGAYLHCNPARIQLTQGQEGKPMLRPSMDSTVQFNVSHSRSLALLAFSARADVGIDVEYLDVTLDTDTVAQTAFSECERRRYRAGHAEDRLTNFFRIWTQKEARVKAHGLAMAHRYFQATEHLAVTDLGLGAQYVGALALRDAQTNPAHDRNDQ